MLALKHLHVIRALFLLGCLLCLTCFRSEAQLESSKWFFGHGVGVDFAGGMPVALQGSKIKTTEGCSAVSDIAGNLLFYTDGVCVWNRNNQIMENGTNLNGNFSSTQSAVVVPSPAQQSIFYIFTLDRESERGGFCYSLVDITKRGGLGEVILKNQPISQNCAEKLVAVRHANNRDVWIVVHDSWSNAFLAYFLGGNGLSAIPVVSNVGIQYDRKIYNTIGYQRISPDRSKIAVAVMGERLVEVFDFDAHTGKVSNPIDLKFNSDVNPYGLEFSPGGQFLYISSTFNGAVYQADLSKNDELAVQKSLCMVGKSKAGKKFGALQLGVDGKIYISEYESKYLSVIRHPDSAGLKCSFLQNAVNLRAGTGMLGLPTFFHEYVRPWKFKTRGAKLEKDLKLYKNYVFDNVYFDFNKTEIKKVSNDGLLLLVAFLKEHKKVCIEITGHADSIGTAEYNEHLAIDRATRIKDLLNAEGIDTARIRVVGKGSREPVTSNFDENGRKLNRRVEFVLKNTFDEYK